MTKPPTDYIHEYEAMGGKFLIEGGRVRLDYPKDQQANLAPILRQLRTHRHEVEHLLLGQDLSRKRGPTQPGQPKGNAIAACGSPYCDGCYDIGGGRRIHPLRSDAHIPPAQRTFEPDNAPCWHCAGTESCSCVVCGQYEKSVSWAAGPCRACKVRKRKEEVIQ